jgi:hypothetical protein
MAYDLRKVLSLGHDGQSSFTSSLQNDEDNNWLVANNNASDDTEDHHDSVEVTLDTSASRDRSDLSFSYALRKVFSREPDVDRKEAQPLSYPYKKHETHYDDQAEHIEVDGRALAISAAVDEGQATLDGSYSMRKAKSCPIAPLYEKQYEELSKKKKGMFGKRRGKNNALATISDDNNLRKDGKMKLQTKASRDDETTRCTTPDNSFADNSYIDKSRKRRFDPWMITLIVLICFILGVCAFAGAYFLPDLLGKAEEIVYTPTDISASPPSGDGTSITFYAMADAPYTDHERENIMPYQIKNLSSSADFLIHLGDLQYAPDGCQEYGYQAASDILKQSKIPVFVIPGGTFVSTTRFSSYIHCWPLSHPP